MRRFAGTHQRASERGTVLLMATVTILVVVGMLALAVDVGYLMNGRAQLQNIVDAAALAGAQGLRTAIEPTGSRTHQEVIIRKLAKDFALFNPIRRADGVTGLELPEEDVMIEYPATYPAQPARVIVKHRTTFPTIFGNVFGISSMNVGAVAMASTGFVDGGTGFISGCWRPILIPDTFYDQNRNVWAISGPASFSDGSVSPSRPGTPEATLPGDHYISRFASLKAGSTRNQNSDFLQQWPLGSGVPSGEATSIRDAYDLGELKYVNGVQGGRNLIGQRIRLRKEDWRIVNFSASGITGEFPTNPIQQIKNGCCTPIRVGQLVQVYTPTADNDSIYASFVQQLQNYYISFVAQGGAITPAASQYKYAQTQNYPTPNANPRVIPVLLCSPIQFSNSANTPQFYVTNIAAFFLEGVGADGSILGSFVREVMTAGTPLEPENEVANIGLLPISVRLVR
ncbi:MAG TPA: Tad domain-containing protein [Blastocatellia bacterium]|nr:Tad domain-containing protein [Blastocatellia bacterium]